MLKYIVHQPTIWDLIKPDEALLENIITKEHPDWKSTLAEFSTSDIFGSDIETFGKSSLASLYPWKGYIRIITVSLYSGKVLLVNLGGYADNREEILTQYQDFFQVYKERCENPNVLIIGANFKFDALWLRVHYGIKCLNIRDIRLISQVLWSGVGVVKAEKGSDRSERCLLSHSLKAIYERCCTLGLNIGIEIDKTEQTSNWGWTLTNTQLNYAAKDSQVLIPIYLLLASEIRKENLQFSAYAECCAAAVFVEMEYRGFPVDVTRIQEILEIYKNNRESVLYSFRQTFPEVQWSSNAQVLKAFQQKFPNLNLTSVDSESLNSLSSEYPEIEGLLNARTYSICISYLESILENCFANSESELVSIRTHFNQIAASGSGRSSCKKSLGKKLPDTGVQLQNPANLPGHWQEQGIPGLREAFTPCGAKYSSLYKTFSKGDTGFDNLPDYLLSLPEEERPTHILQIVDLSQAHQRIACELFRDPTLTTIYKENRDAHVIMGMQLAEIKGVPYASEEEFESCVRSSKKGSRDMKDIHAALCRKAGKVGNYSGLNLGGVARIAKALKEQEVPASLEDARQVQKAWRTTYEVLYNGILTAISNANRLNYDFSNFNDLYGNPISGVYGSIRGLTNRKQYGKKLPNKYNKGALEVPLTDMCSFQWLSAEADIIKYAMGTIHLEFQKGVWNSYICNFAHDELNIIHELSDAKEAGTFVWNTVKEALERFIRTIPVVDPTDHPYKTFCTSWSQK